jgi:Rod binding domain-containing protein
VTIEPKITPGLSGGLSSPAKVETQKSTREAATEFESLLVGQMLKTMREGKEESWLGGESSAGNESIMEMAEQQVARAIAQRGGFGIARMLDQTFAQARTSSASPQGLTTASLLKAGS